MEPHAGLKLVGDLGRGPTEAEVLWVLLVAGLMSSSMVWSLCGKLRHTHIDDQIMMIRVRRTRDFDVAFLKRSTSVDLMPVF